MKKKTTSNQPVSICDNIVDPIDTIAELTKKMNPSKLSRAQRATMFNDICAAVMAASPSSLEESRQWMTILAGFIHDVAPVEGGHLWSFLTDSSISSWVSQGALTGRSRHTLNSRRGVLTRILAAHRGVAVGRATQRKRSRSSAPLGLEEVQKLMRACEQDSRSALRGYIAHVAAGVSRATRRVSFTVYGRRCALTDGSRTWIIAPTDIDLKMMNGDRLIDEDWVALKGVAMDLGIRLSEGIAAQTFRALAVADDDLTIGQRFITYGMNEVTITATAEHLTPLSEEELQRQFGTLRDGRPGAECTADNAPTRSPRPPKGGAKGGSRPIMSRKTSRAATKRLAAVRMAEASDKTLKAKPVEDYLTTFVPDLDDDLWESIASVVRASVVQCAFATVETARKHAVAITSYLRWRSMKGYSTNASTSLTFEAIDAFFVHGMPDLSERSRRDYRSRLRAIAKRVNSSVVAPPALELGYNQVNPGYTNAEEVALRRVSLDQGDVVARRRLCAIVGLCCGAGLSSAELRALRRRDISINDDGMIVVTVPGDRPRRTVVRRIYETHVLVAIEGLQFDETVLPQLKSSSPITAILKGADLFDDAPAIDTRRLRTTWITWLMNQRIPLRLAFEASGLQSARTFYDMLAYLPESSNAIDLRDGGAA